MLPSPQGEGLGMRAIQIRIQHYQKLLDGILGLKQ